MEFTKNNLIEMEKEATNCLCKHVCNYLIERWDDYSAEHRVHLVTDVLNHGCVSGCVSHLIYYSDTIKFYETYKEEINSLLYELMDEIGSWSPKDVFRDWDTQDPLCLDTHNQNLMAWFGFEEKLRQIAREFEELEDLV